MFRHANSEDFFSSFLANYLNLFAEAKHQIQFHIQVSYAVLRYDYHSVYAEYWLDIASYCCAANLLLEIVSPWLCTLCATISSESFIVFFNR